MSLIIELNKNLMLLSIFNLKSTFTDFYLLENIFQFLSLFSNYTKFYLYNVIFFCGLCKIFWKENNIL